MAYSRWSKDHKHILPQTVHLPAWGALAIPYRWMLKESGFEIAAELGLEACREREPEAPGWLADTSWIQSFDNQEMLLNAFAAPLVENESLVLFYATRTPLCDDERRVLLGAAILGTKHQVREYNYAQGSGSGLRAMVWERPFQHSLRPAQEGGGFTSGFVMPYHAILRECEKRSELDPAAYVAFAPDDARAQFSYGSEHVSHGSAAAALLAARAALENIAQVLEGPWQRYISWIDERLGRLWKMQGPAPGLGVALSALHPGFNGTLFAIALADELEENVDPWPVIDAIFTGKRFAPAGSPPVTGMLQKRWAKLSRQPAELDRLKVLARLELTKMQAQRAFHVNAVDTLANPFVLFEQDRLAADPIAFGTIDRGLYPGKEVATAHQLPSSCAPGLAEYDNEFRLRAACVETLERSATQGHTILPIEKLVEAAADLGTVHPVPLDADTVDICSGDFAPTVIVDDEGGKLTVQLDRYVSSAKLIGRAVADRLKATDAAGAVDWRALVDGKFGAFPEGNKDEDRARNEKAAALTRLAGSRIGVLIGPAGTGKTSVLQLLLERNEIVGPRVRLLAPTGKARVRLGQETGCRDQVQTVAQFLLGARYDADTGRYFTNPLAPKIEATTCIVDESSMLTEDMLAAIIEALPQTCRLILVGDPYQLPPIGAGCPFVDIIEHLKRDHEGKGVGELSTPRRQTLGANGGQTEQPSALSRADVQLAAIFSGRELPPGEDEIVVNAISGTDDDTVKYRQWENATDLGNLVEEVLAQELACAPEELADALEQSLGAVRADRGYLNFERGCADSAEAWQILSVNRNTPGGSVFLNRRFKERLRGGRLAQAVDSNRVPGYQEWMRFVKPRGPEQIVYGDKVICVRNHHRQPWVYDTKANGEKEYIANGEIGIVTGQRQWGRKNPQFTHVELAGRADRNFSFKRRDFSEDGNPYLELAYAITVHKAQGSEFGSVILVLPARSRLVSREMIYTALTRQKKRIWILHQGPFDKFLSLRQYAFSDIASRFTNLLRTPKPQEVHLSAEIPRALAGAQRTFLEERLIHRTLRGEMVSSKNELAIANILYTFERAGRLNYQIEPLLPFNDGRGRWADFLIEAGGNSWYWEHCGMMADEQYRKRWHRKKMLYAANGYDERSASNPAGRLIITDDGPGKGLDSQVIEALIRELVAS
ncbi:AAA family ATPase [Paracoccus sp. PARArs4]|uniref:AAA family ATPase n=1 Tax=Paracoccus sp. PARArs4 TaxID=2853442 RepID=UPI0024A6E46D|nr:AAA family ATPase [Paracoccus sp. PARArs4]